MLRQHSGIFLKLILLSGIYGFSYSALAQVPDSAQGFYFTIPCTKYSKPKQTVTATRNGEVCITGQPVVNLEELVYVSELREVKQENYVFFDFAVSPKGYESLQKLAAVLPTGNIALMVNDEVMLTFTLDQLKPTRKFTIHGTYIDPEIRLVHERLKALHAPPQSN